MKERCSRGRRKEGESLTLIYTTTLLDSLVLQRTVWNLGKSDVWASENPFERVKRPTIVLDVLQYFEWPRLQELYLPGRNLSLHPWALALRTPLLQTLHLAQNSITQVPKLEGY